MSSFSFNFASKPKKEHKTSTTNKIYKIITAKQDGYVWIDLDGVYKVLCNDIYYPIKESNFECAGKLKVYLQNGKDTKRLCYIRNTDHPQSLSKHYKPFDIGSYVKGNIVQNTITKIIYFDIKYIPKVRMGEEGLKARHFYKEHFDEIMANMK